MAKLPDETVAALRAQTEALHKAADRLTKVGGQLVYGVHLTTARAFVWARYRGADPAAAIAKSFYGDPPYGPGALSHVAALVEHLTATAAQPQQRKAA